MVKLEQSNKEKDKLQSPENVRHKLDACQHIFLPAFACIYVGIRQGALFSARVQGLHYCNTLHCTYVQSRRLAQALYMIEFPDRPRILEVGSYTASEAGI